MPRASVLARPQRSMRLRQPQATPGDRQHERRPHRERCHRDGVPARSFRRLRRHGHRGGVRPGPGYVGRCFPGFPQLQGRGSSWRLRSVSPSWPRSATSYVSFAGASCRAGRAYAGKAIEVSTSPKLSRAGGRHDDDASFGWEAGQRSQGSPRRTLRHLATGQSRAEGQVEPEHELLAGFPRAAAPTSSPTYSAPKASPWSAYR